MNVEIGKIDTLMLNQLKFSMKTYSLEPLIEKEQVKIVIFDKHEDEDYHTLLISNRDYESSLRIEYNNLAFERELHSLDIRYDCDEWVCFQEVTREEIKTELESRGYLVVMSEDY